VYSQGDRGDKFYIILRGKVQVSIPDPIGNGLVEPKVVVIEEEEVD
jgi:CRP-like cAMP-binding protein